MFNVEPHRVENLRLHTYCFDGLFVNVKIAWEMDGEEIDLPVAFLTQALHEPSWECGTPLECGHSEPHWSLTVESDLGYPLIVTVEPCLVDDRKLTVVDGKHRLLKAWLLGKETVKVKMVDYGRLLEEAGVPLSDVAG